MRRTRKTGGTTQRGYGYSHQALRERHRPAVEAGQVNCWRCGQWIAPGAPWDLGHDDNDRTIYRGPEHRRCNRATAPRAARRKRSQETAVDRPALRFFTPET